ncbi:MAG: WYL domain-containing protein [Phascolarctobacterium sp.]|nr:WYL domain-containing protein [Phascolarctobacterium sp.]
MSDIFSEVYGTYYNIVADILGKAASDGLTLEQLKRVVYKEGYEESGLELLPALTDEKWLLLTKEIKTPLRHKPSMPLTLLQKQWLKAVLLDERVRLFFTDDELANEEKALEDVEPLYRPEQFVFFDRFVDGDAYKSARYRENFRQILQAIKDHTAIDASYRTNKDNVIVWTNLVPITLEYSAKDDKFRLQGMAGSRHVTLNLGKIITVELGEPLEKELPLISASQEKLVLELVDERHTMMRALMHFSDLAKETEKLDDTHYLLTVFYDKSDETEMVYRVLSFGPTMKVREPECFVELLKERLKEQMQAAQ